ncbi:hypothetical protein [Taibaiella helva]|uniref:hypothetical protein n=1 Tax=Taibaiella helva TaxID=2301235 RepID=UPI000E58A0CF|nr:hypothetical protein [Taibaiella helva]
MQKRNVVISEIKSDISAILNKGNENRQPGDEKLFNLSALRAGLFKAGYSAREINATMASYAKRGLMKPSADPRNDGEYIFSKKAYEL